MIRLNPDAPMFAFVKAVNKSLVDGADRLASWWVEAKQGGNAYPLSLPAGQVAPPFDLATIESAFKLTRVMAAGSSCVRRQVGAALLSPDGTVMSLGYNHVKGAALRQPCTYTCPRAMLTAEECAPGSAYDVPGQECYARHAEVHAISLMAGRIGDGWWVFVNTEPCPDCVRYMEDLGLQYAWQD